MSSLIRVTTPIFLVMEATLIMRPMTVQGVKFTKAQYLYYSNPSI